MTAQRKPKPTDQVERLLAALTPFARAARRVVYYGDPPLTADVKLFASANAGELLFELLAGDDQIDRGVREAEPLNVTHLVEALDALRAAGFEP